MGCSCSSSGKYIIPEEPEAVEGKEDALDRLTDSEDEFDPVNAAQCAADAAEVALIAALYCAEVSKAADMAAQIAFEKQQEMLRQEYVRNLMADPDASWVKSVNTYERGNEAEVQRALDSKADINEPDVEYMYNKLDGAKFTVLMWAARNGNLKSVKSLLENGADPNVGCKQYGAKPLHEAAGGGHVECIDALLVAGARAQDQDSRGHTALMLAVKGGHRPCIEAIITHAKANESIQDGRVGANNEDQADPSLQNVCTDQCFLAEDLWKQTDLHGCSARDRLSGHLAEGFTIP